MYTRPLVEPFRSIPVVVGIFQSLEAKLNSIVGSMPSEYAKLQLCKENGETFDQVDRSCDRWLCAPPIYLCCRGHCGLFGLAQSIRLFISAAYIHFNARRLKDKQFSLKAHKITNARAADLHMVIDARVFVPLWLRLACPLIVIRIHNQFTHADFACIEIDFIPAKL